MQHLKIAAGVLAIVSMCACSRAGSADAESAAAPAPAEIAALPTGSTTASSSTTETNATGQLIVNGVALDEATRAALAQAYGAVPDGEYWYDPTSGLVGRAGGPSSAHILPGLALGGALKADASGGGAGALTGVFINGREVHPDEFAYLMALFGAVNPGRYWLGPSFVGGYEGGPPMFDLKASAAQSATGGPGYNKSTLFGDLMSDGQCSGYFDPSSGSSVMTGNC